MERACSHFYPVEDVHEGTLVCPDCGLVLQDRTMVSSTQNTKSESHQLEAHYETFKDVCHRLHLPPSFIIKTFKSNWIIPAKPEQILPSMLGAIYITLVKIQEPRSLHNLCQAFRIRTEEVWPYAFQGQAGITYPHQIVELALCPLALPYNDVNQIRTIIKENYDKLPYSPRTVVATAAYLYLKDTPHHQSLTNIAKALDVSVMSLHRCKTKMMSI